MHRCDHRLTGPLGTILEAITQSIEPHQKSWPGGEPQQAREQLTEDFSAPAAWGAHAVFETLQEMADEDATITVDSGAHRILLCHKLRMHRPMQLLQSAGFCTMGVALPLAAGAKAASPDKTFVAVLGDGGLEMGLGELATLRDEGLNIIAVVLQDKSLALIDLKQKKLELERCGVGLGKTRFEDIASTYGGHGVRVSDRTALSEELKAASTRKTFSLIVCDIEASDYIGRI